jgi:uncharacterized protein YheU (UPF0270 family)
MSSFLEIPAGRLEAAVLDALLEEFATRDGTDYGTVETAVDQRVSQLRARLQSGEMALLFDSDSEQWDLLSREQASELLAS